MFEIRQDYLTQAKVFMSEARSSRPNFFSAKKSEAESSSEGCPFCPENRSDLTDIVSTDYNGRIIILKNKYPAIGGKHGTHEVMVDTNIHAQGFISFSQSEMERSLQTIIKRGTELEKNENAQFVQIFKNDGKGSGASIDHSHWQLLTMPFIPEKQTVIHNNFKKYYNENKKSYIEHLYEVKDLIVYENNGAFAYMPYAAIFEYNINIAPKKHISSISHLEDEDIAYLAVSLKAVLSGLQAKLGEFPFNICFQNPPKGEYSASHFYIEIIPRLGSFAGLELGSQTHMIGRFPEMQAPLLAKLIADTGK